MTDGMNHYVTDLEPDEFSVFEDGVKQDITFFNRRQQPIALSLLLDSSASMEEHLTTLQAAATNFVKRLRANDIAQVIDFDSRVEIRKSSRPISPSSSPRFSRTVAGGSTPLHNAIYIALRELGKVRAVANRTRRQALILFTDGEDTSSSCRSRKCSISQAPERPSTPSRCEAQTCRRRVFVEAEFVLRALARETGGRAFFPMKIDDPGRGTRRSRTSSPASTRSATPRRIRSAMARGVALPCRSRDRATRLAPRMATTRPSLGERIGKSWCHDRHPGDF